MSAPEWTRPQPGRASSITELLPGFHGYRERELLREDDRAVRDRTSEALRGHSSLLRRLSAEQLRGGPHELAAGTERLSAELSEMAESVARAGGGGGLFGRSELRRRGLEQLLTLDVEILRAVLETGARVTALRAAAPEPGRYQLILQGVSARAQSLRALLDRRAELLRQE